MPDICVDLWGPRACFTPPYGKVERLSYPVPTPSAIRGILSGIYAKNVEFYWRIKRIEVMNPIQYFDCKRNELKSRLQTTPKPIDASQDHTPRNTVMLKDVKYRVTASIMPLLPRFQRDPAPLEAQATRRIEHGSCFYQPYLGIRECECYFAPADMSAKPIPVTQDFNLMTYDTFVPHELKGAPSLSLYHATMVDGVIEVPEYDSPYVLKNVPVQMLGGVQ